MSRSRFDAFFPAFRTATVAGLFALLAGCATEPAPVAMLAPADVAEIEMTTDSLFGPIALAEIEITVDSIQEDESARDGFAAADVPTEDPARSAARAWLAGMESAAAKVAPVAKAPVRAATTESYGASGGGVGLAGTAFAENPPTSFSARRKTISTRGPSQAANDSVASIASTDTTSASRSVTRALSRSQTSVQQSPEPLTPAMIKTSVKRQMGKVRACYERALKSDEGLAGKLVMSWKIKADGTVRSVSVARDDLGSDKVSMCVTDAVASFKFPQGTETVSIEYPMSFKSENTW